MWGKMDTIIYRNVLTAVQEAPKFRFCSIPTLYQQTKIFFLHFKNNMQSPYNKNYKKEDYPMMRKNIFMF